ncbi:hypothetical protein EPO14_01920 [Patescibacteria group bacterium]|nr:MAG: hypothetical protein EPO14_01920 [Patescibacteria group bacterium]
MKISKILHVVSVIVGVAGIVALVGAYIAGPSGTVFGLNQNHLFIDAGIRILIAIWLQLATLHHMTLEKKGEIV